MMATALWAQAFRQTPQPLQLHLAGPVGAAHPQVFQGTSEAGQFVALEVGDSHQRIGLDDLGPDADRAEDLARHLHRHRRVPPQAVAHDQRGTHDGIGEAVLDGTGERRHRLFAFAGVEGR
jgi:hypothetical protein